MLVGVVGKANVGKSSFFKAITALDVKIADFPFTTIEPNRGVGYVVADCPCKAMGRKCNPRNSGCKDGRRYVPIELLDVAGLVPGAHAGKGMGNKFLDDLRNASVLIHVLDCSGTTDENGRKTEGYDPTNDVEWLEQEIDAWIAGILEKARTVKGDNLEAMTKALTGLGVGENDIKDAYRQHGADVKKLASAIRKKSKPMLIAANKMDMEASKGNFESVKSKFADKPVVPCSAEYEIALKLAAKHGLVDYDGKNFQITGDVTPAQKALLDRIGEFVREFGSTGVQRCLNDAVFKLLDCIVIYPVENENNYSDKKGNVLPDAYLVPRGTTARRFAGFVHSDFEKNFICAIDARKKMRISADHVLQDGDIVKIVSGK